MPPWLLRPDLSERMGRRHRRLAGYRYCAGRVRAAATLNVHLRLPGCCIGRRLSTAWLPPRGWPPH